MVNKKPETTTTEVEDNTEQLARDELNRLSRQLRLMENDKKAYLEESNAAINQQRYATQANSGRGNRRDIHLGTLTL